MTVSIGIVGTGTVAQALGRLLREAGEPVGLIAGRSDLRASRAARFIGGDVRAVALSEIPATATHVLIATSDDRIGPVAEALAASGFHNGIALHTCGAKPPDSLSTLQLNGVHCGVLHPLQSLVSPEQAAGALHGIPFGVSGDARALEWAERIVSLLDGRVIHLNPARMSLYHAAAVMASSGVVAVINMAARSMSAAGVNGDAGLAAIEPLCRTTLNNIFAVGPGDALSGPLVRGDTATVTAHLAALNNSKADLDLYRAASGGLLDLAESRGLSAEKRTALAAALDFLQPGITNGQHTRSDH